MQMDYESKLQDAIWIAKSLFDRKLVTGCTGNISFLHEDCMYISKSGTCFGRLNENSFATISLKGEIQSGTPSKEYPIHLSLYHVNKELHGVIHTHSLYSTILSCMKDSSIFAQKLYAYTPYLSMLTKGTLSIIPYHPPGSNELYQAFEKAATKTVNTYLLNNHGIIAGSQTLLQAFNIIEEFEATAKLHYCLRQYPKEDIRKIEML